MTDKSVAEALATISNDLATLAARVQREGAAPPNRTECAVVRAPAPAPAPTCSGPNGRLVYEGCFAARDPDGRPVMSLLGTVASGQDAVVAECTRLAAAATKDGNPVTFGVQKGTECWLATDATAARRGGMAAPGRCALRPDARGQVVGGADAVSLYSYTPPWVMARYVRILRKVASASVQSDPPRAYLHVVGIAVTDHAGQSVAVRDVAVSGSLIAPPESLPGEPAADRGPADTMRRHETPAPGSIRGVCCLPPDIGAYVLFDLGDAHRIRGVHLRNRSAPGHADIENRLCGCWVQLLREPPPNQSLPVWERQVTFGAPSYDWEVW